MARVLITGMSGTGKSTLLVELHQRGHLTVDTDYDNWVLPSGVWDPVRMASLLERQSHVIVSGTVENQIDFYDNRFVGADIWSNSYAKIGEAMGADGYRVNTQKDLAEALEAAKKNRRPAVIEIMTDGTRLAPPFRRDALALPTRFLPKYAHLDKSHFGKEKYTL